MGSVGVLALQGDFVEHVHSVKKLGWVCHEVRDPRDLKEVDGLIIPGGESTTIGKLARRSGLMEAIRERALSGMPLWGTCAGLIFMAKDLGIHHQPMLGLMDVTVQRNAFGAQLDSFASELPVTVLGKDPFHAIFIRAPIIQHVGHDVNVLATLPEGRIVAAEQNNLLGTAFHPELTDDLRFHQYFLSKIR